MRRTANDWIEQLQLTPHVEGGAYRQTYRAPLILPKAALPPAFSGDRAASTAIYFLLRAGEFSAFHRIAADEVWHFYDGDPLLVHEIRADGALVTHSVGADPGRGAHFQAVVTAGSWFAAEIASGGAYALVGCTVAPGFDFADFALGKRDLLIGAFPQHAALITRLSRP